MIRSLFGVFLAAFLMGGFSLSAFAQDADAPAEAEPPRLTPEERRAQWEEMRYLSPEERQERLRELRRNRRGDAPPEPVAEAESAPEVAVPERYLDQLEFRSLLTLDGVTEFRLRNPYENRTFVISAEEGANGIEVVAFDPEQSALTLRHEGETRVLFLERSRVAELEQPSESDQDRRRRRWEGRRERFREFRETWQEAAKTSPELREIETQFRDLMGDYRNNRSALRNVEPGTPEYERLRTQEQEMREEFRLLTEYSLLEVQKNPAFAEHDVESLNGMMRGMMMYTARGDRDGNRERGERRRWRRDRDR